MAYTTYYVVGPSSGWSDPTATEIKAGQLSGGGAATASGSEASLGASGTHTFATPASGLSSGVLYKTAYVASDGVTDSNVVISHAWTLLTASIGAYTTTGTSASVSLGRFLTASAGSYSITGSSATLALGHYLTAEVGNYTLAGGSATLTHQSVGNYALSGSSGNYVVSGSDSTLVWTHSYTLLGATGSYSVSGGTASLAWNKHFILTAASGDYVITGGSVTLDFQSSFTGDYTLSASSGAYTLSGSNATLTFVGQTTLSYSDLQAIWNVQLDSGYTAKEMMRIMFAALSGKRVGLGTATEYYMAPDETTPRITFTPTDSEGNGTPILDASDV